MNYISMKVREAMQGISSNEIYLPAIQRKFVWGPERIEKLFDSIMRGYPIGTFLFWFVKGDTKDEYTFYQFIQDYHERDNAWNQVAPKPHLKDEFIGVLDGQQRLNSMYVALQGSYAYKRKRGRWNDNAAFPRRDLYINLFFQPEDDDESGVLHKFVFLTQEESQVVDAQHYWFKVKDVLNWQDIQPVFPKIMEATEKYPQHQPTLMKCGAPLLNLLWQRLCSDDVINYFSIREQELDKVVDIFVRVNSAGVQLSKTDLLFSSIVAHWDEGRSNIEALIRTLNAKGDRFDFDNDFVMRSCLVLTDLPILFKVNSFKKENIDRIKQNWPKIKQSLETMVDLLVEWGFSGETLPALNSVIPIAYFAFKDGDVKASQSALRQYLIRALLNQIFTSQTDRVLGAIRDHLRSPQADSKTYGLKNSIFVLNDMLKAKLPDDRTLQINNDDIEDILGTKKGPQTFMALSLLYPHFKFAQIKFHQDHIHPWSRFNTTALEKLNLSEEKIEQWQEDRDKLPNLQLMEGALNQSKNAMPFETWIEDGANGPKDKSHFKQTNFIPPNISLKIEDFEAFYEARKALLKQELQTILIV